MHRSVIIKKRIQNLQTDDIIFQNVGKFARGGHFADAKIKDTLEKHDVLYISTLKFLDKENPSEQEIKEHLFERGELYDTDLCDIKEDIFNALKEVYVPFSETDAIFDNKKKKRQITAKVLLDPNPKELFQADIDAGSLALIPAFKLTLLQGKLMEAYRYFNGFRRKSTDTKGQSKVFPRQNYSSVRLHTIYHPSLNKVEALGDDVIWHAVDTTLYFLATLANINKIRNAEGRPLSSLKYLVEGNVATDQEFCYRSDIVVNASLGALLAPIGYMHTLFLPILHARLGFKEHDAIPEEVVNLLKKASLISFNLVRNRDDISAIAKLIMRKQTLFQNGSGENYLKDGSPLHEFVRLYQVISAYDSLIHPFLAKSPVSREDAIGYLRNESSLYDPARDGQDGKRYDARMLEEFLNILAPYELSEVVYLVDKKDKDTLLYKGYVVNYNNDNTTPLVSLLFDYRNQKNFEAGELIFDLPNSRIFMLKDGKVLKQLSSDKLANLKIFDFELSPLSLSTYKNPILD